MADEATVAAVKKAVSDTHRKPRPKQKLTAAREQQAAEPAPKDVAGWTKHFQKHRARFGDFQ